MYKKLSIDAIQALVKSYFQYKKNQKQERKSLRALEREAKPRLQDADESVPGQLKGDQQVQDLSPDFSDNNHANQRGTDKEVPVTVEEKEESEEEKGEEEGEKNEEEEEGKEEEGEEKEEEGEGR